jgi:hypothetical protein
MLTMKLQGKTILEMLIIHSANYYFPSIIQNNIFALVFIHVAS